MKVLKGRHDLRRVEQRGRRREASSAEQNIQNIQNTQNTPKYTEIPAQVGKELAPADVREEQVEEGGVLATPREGDQERVLDLLLIK